MQHRPLSCWQCGTVISTSGGRCPACGTQQAPSAESSTPDSGDVLQGMPPSKFSEHELPSEPDAQRSSSALPWIALAAGLAIIGAGAVLLRPRTPAESAAPMHPAAPTASPPASGHAPPSDLGPFDPRAVDPMDILGRAKTRALVWSKDALLISMRANPVVSGRVDVGSGGTIEFLFGKPTGEGLGPGAKTSGKRLRIALTSTGTEIGETGGPPTRAALEPNCPLDAAAHAALSAGLLQDTPLLAVYDLSEKLAQKPVWHISSPGTDKVPRQIDGMSCAVLVAR